MPRFGVLISGRGGRFGLALLLCLPGLAPSLDARAQIPGCTIDDATPLRIYQCQEGLRVTAEKSARVSAFERNGRVAGFRVEGGAAHIDTGGARPGGLTVETPHALIEVSGTRFAVDAEPGRTAVFVREGAVSVKAGPRQVALRDGEGVDVAPGQPLEVRRWGAERAARLLARLGQR